MAFLVSPGVQVTEKDLTNVVPAVSASIGAFAGPFKWGPTGTAITCASEGDLLLNFGKPDAAHARSFLTAASYLKYGNTLKVSRSAGDDCVNAVSTFLAKTTLTVTVSGTYSATSLSTFTTSGSTTIILGKTALSATVGIGTSSGSTNTTTNTISATSNTPGYTLITNITRNTTSTNSSVDFSQIGNVVTATIIVGSASGATTASGTTIINLSSLYVSGSGTTYSGVQIGNIDQFNNNNSVSLTTSNVSFVARYPGAKGNSLGVFIVTARTRPNDAYAQQFDYIPTFNSNNPTFVTVTGTSSAASLTTASTITVPASAFSTVPLTTSMYVVSSANLPANGPIKVSSFTSSGSNYVITASEGVSAVPVSAPFTFFEADEIHALVIDLDGGISGTSGTVLEKFQNLSLLSDSKRADGTNNFYRDYINRNSSYVYSAGFLSTQYMTGDELASTDATYVELPDRDEALSHILGSVNYLSGVQGPVRSSGFDGATIGTAGSISTALDVFADAATIDVNLLFTGDFNGETTLSTGEQKAQQIAEARKDTIAFISAPPLLYQQTSEAAKQAAILAKFNDGTAARNSYSVFDSSPLYVYNKYQDNYIWIPACGHMAGLCANADLVADAWFSPAGYNRGNLRGVTKLAFNPTQTSRDELYKASVNPIVSFPGQGIILFGDKTAQAKPSAFDRINVRRLFIVLEKAIATAAKYQLFELNDRFTQAMFRNMVEPFLREIAGRRGITDFLVVCDSTNNTPEVIDTNRFVADIFIKPARSINFISLNFIATRTGVSFAEVAGA